MKEPKDVLGLGSYLVRELGFHDSCDTLGRWMSHHVAEQIAEAKNARTVARRRVAQRNAVSTILKIWEHRRVLPGRANPIGPYSDLLRFIELLRTHSPASPFGYFSGRADTRSDELVARLFEAFTCLLGALLFVKVGQLGARPVPLERAALKALGREERRLLKNLRLWMELVAADSASTGRSMKRSRAKQQSSWPAHAVSWLDEIVQIAPELRGALESSEPPTQGPDDDDAD